MVRKHYEKIMSKRGKKIESVLNKLEQLDLDYKEPLYMDTNGNIDWNKLAKHVREATNGR